MWQRHTDMHHMLWDGLKEMGLEPYVPAEQDRLVTVNTITVRSFPPPMLPESLGSCLWFTVDFVHEVGSSLGILSLAFSGFKGVVVVQVPEGVDAVKVITNAMDLSLIHI